MRGSSQRKDRFGLCRSSYFIENSTAPMLSLHFGPQFGYLLSAREKVLLTDNKATTNVKNWYEDYDLGFALGMEFNLPLQTFLTIRYVYGLSTVTSYYGADEKNNLLQISAGYRFKGR